MRGRVFHGSNLRELRRAVCPDIREFAELVDYSWRHIQMIETWGRQPSDKLVRRFLAELSRLHGRPVNLDEVSTEASAVEDAA